MQPNERADLLGTNLATLAGLVDVGLWHTQKERYGV